MECPICGAIADRAAIDRLSALSPMCGESMSPPRSLIVVRAARSCTTERANILEMARRSAEPDRRPMVTPYLLA
jgi:hypothetical protein